MITTKEFIGVLVFSIAVLIWAIVTADSLAVGLAMVGIGTLIVMWVLR